MTDLLEGSVARPLHQPGIGEAPAMITIIVMMTMMVETIS